MSVFLFIKYASLVIFPLLVFFVFLLYKKRTQLLWLLISGFFVFGSVVFFWSRYIEPQVILVQETSINVGFTGSIGLISDLHLGVYKDEKFLRRVVSKLNQQDIDMVLIAGDLSYWPEEEELEDLFAPLQDLQIPCYAVLGNHDVEQPGPPIRQELSKVLESYNVRLLENEFVEFDEFFLLGLGSHWNGEDNVSLLDQFSANANVVVLTHNPDTISKYVNDKADLTLAGHTHGGQLRIPFLYKKAIPTEGDFDRGLSQEDTTLLFTTAGVGETALPMRLFNPPCIDVLRLVE